MCAAGLALHLSALPWYAQAMALYHMHVQAISRGSGESAVAAAAYRCGESLVDERTGETHDYSRRSGVEHAEIIASEQAPEWARERERLWNQAEQAERRKDAQVAREVEFALPAELSERERRGLVREFVREQFVSRGMVADVAHHSGEKPGREPNPHAHVMLTMRRLDGESFATTKEREWNDKDLLKQWRSAWARETNRALERGGHDERVDHRTLRAQRQDALARGDTQAAAKLDREPQVHLGKALHMEERWIDTEKGNRYAEIAEGNHRTAALPEQRQEITGLQRQINVLVKEQRRDDEQKARDALTELAARHHSRTKARRQKRNQVELSR